MGEGIMNEYYYELIVTPKSYYELYLDLIISLTTEAIEEKDGDIIIRSEESLEIIKEGIEAFTQELSRAFNTTIICDIIVEKKVNKDWIKAYQDSVRAIEVDKFYIHPSWEKQKDGKINIQIDPTLAFGSGHHETTNECLKAISRYVKENDEVCDIGCGSGILAIAAAKLGATVDICDTDKKAVQDSLENFDKNGIKPDNYWVGSINNTDKKYDLIIANIVADVLIMIAKDLKNSLNNNGILILSGILDKFEDKLSSKFQDLTMLEVITKNEWRTFVYKG
jgi:ribosomal protein L11 methyltransferase